MAYKTPGALGTLAYIREKRYGELPETGKMSFMGIMITATADQKRDEQVMEQDGSRLPGAIIRGAATATMTADVSLYRDDGDYKWTDAIKLAMGGDGVADDLPSVAMTMKIARDQYQAVMGAKMNKLTIAADGVGKKLTAKLDIKAKRLTEERPEPLTGNGIEPAEQPQLVPVTYNRYPQMLIGDIAADIPTHKFTYTWSNGLKEQPGIDPDGMAYAAGEGLIPDRMDIKLSFEVTSSSAYWDNLKLKGLDGVQIRHQIGGHTLTFDDCILQGSLPARGQSTYNETIEFTCKGGVTIA